MPVRALAAVSVVADQCVVAGSATTIAMLMEEQGPEWLAGAGLPHVFMDQDARIGGTLAPTRPVGDARFEPRPARAPA
jgi:thiamine biosynthesis lipoprotein